MESILIYLLAGCVTGLLSGLFGIGGGAIIVPVLLVVFTTQEVSPAVMMHMAVGSSLAVIVITSISSIRAHWRLDGVLWPVFRRLAPGIVAGTLLGAVVADWLSGDALRLVFATFLLFVAIRLGFQVQPRRQRQLPGAAGLTAVGGGIGMLSALVGIGGGSLTVPFLARCGIAMRQAVGTSAACGLPIAVTGTVGFMATGWNNPALPPLTSGYIYWPAVASIALASVALVPLGAKLAHRLPGHILRRLFAVMLAIIAIRLYIGF